MSDETDLTWDPSARSGTSQAEQVSLTRPETVAKAPEEMEGNDLLSFFLAPPRLEVAAVLEIEALAPLSMVSSIPGHYYRSERKPTEHMIWGMLENALGLHLATAERTSLLHPRNSPLRKRAKKQIEREIRAGRSDQSWLDHPWITGSDVARSGSAFTSLLQYHLRVDTMLEPVTLPYEDYWSRLLREKNESFVGGARHSDVRVDDVITLSNLANPTRPKRKDGEVERDAATGRIKCEPMLAISDRADAEVRSPDEVLTVIRTARDFYDHLQSANPEYYLAEEGLAELTSHPFFQVVETGRDKIHVNALRPFFPRFFVSPRVREYVIPQGPYRVRVTTTRPLANRIAAACADPAAPLYLGTSEGWVDVSWQELGDGGVVR